MYADTIAFVFFFLFIIIFFRYFNFFQIVLAILTGDKTGLNDCDLCESHSAQQYAELTKKWKEEDERRLRLWREKQTKNTKWNKIENVQGWVRKI